MFSASKFEGFRLGGSFAGSISSEEFLGEFSFTASLAQESSGATGNKIWNVSLELTILHPEAFGCRFRILAVAEALGTSSHASKVWLSTVRVTGMGTQQWMV